LPLQSATLGPSLGLGLKAKVFVLGLLTHSLGRPWPCCVGLVPCGIVNIPASWYLTKLPSPTQPGHPSKGINRVLAMGMATAG